MAVTFRITASPNFTVKTFDLGELKINYGRFDDPRRIEEIAGKLPLHFHPYAGHFPHLCNWPQGIRRESLKIVSFPSRKFSDTYEINRWLESLGYDLQGFPQLCAAMSLKGLDERLFQEGIVRVEATNPPSVHLSHLIHHTPCFYCGPTPFRGLGSKDAAERRWDEHAFLVG